MRKIIRWEQLYRQLSIIRAWTFLSQNLASNSYFRGSSILPLTDGVSQSVNRLFY